MPIYVFENPQGERIEKSFPMGKAPKKIGEYERVITFPMSVQFKGAGWAGTAGKERFKVSWGEVEKITKESDRLAKEADKANRKNIKENIIEHL